MRIKLYEEFTHDTINKNNFEYDNYLKYNKNRSGMVAWTAPRSQIKNFNLVGKHIEKGSVLDFGCGIGDFSKYLKSKNKLSKYLGVDINPNFIDIAKNSYNLNFKSITDVSEITGNYDYVCAIGVFTWFITRDDFINTINRLYYLCNKSVLITCLEGTNVLCDDEEWYWKSTYRYYNEELFNKLFPNYNITYNSSGNTLLVKINKD